MPTSCFRPKSEDYFKSDGGDSPFSEDTEDDEDFWDQDMEMPDFD